MKRAICYMRTSTEKQELSFKAQKTSCKKWAKENDVEIIAFYEERITGTAPLEKRQVLTEAIARLGVESADYLLAAKRDRLSRTVYLHATLHMVVAKANPSAKVVIADGNGNGDSIEDDLMANMLAAFAQYERDLIKLRIQAALEEKKKKGERLGSPPYGWKVDRGPEGMDIREIKRLPLVKNESEQAVLRKMIEFRGQGLSCDHTAKMLNEAGYRTRRGNWHATSVSRALNRAGEMEDFRKRKSVVDDDWKYGH